MKRRAAIGVMAASAAAVLLRPLSALARATPVTKSIPSTGEKVPVVGLGSWITFNVGDDPELRDECAAVMQAFFHEGGRLIDSSPMYGSSQAVIGYGLAKLGRPPTLFSADKVWISSGSRGPEQIEESRALWGIRRFDLLQVHNLLAWEDHLSTLFAIREPAHGRSVRVRRGVTRHVLSGAPASRPRRSVSSRQLPSIIKAPSCSSSQRLRSSPPPKPVSAPFAPTTRWQGTMMGIGFFPLAAPTARVRRTSPKRRAKSL